MDNILSQMVKETKPTENILSEDQLDIPTEETSQEEIPEPEARSIPIASLSNWIGSNEERFPNIRVASISVTGVDPEEQLVVTVPAPTPEVSDKRKLIVFDDAHLKPVLDLQAVDMQIYTNGFRIIYDIGDQKFIKSYGMRTGLISTFCYDVDDVLIPYAMVRSKKHDTEIPGMPAERLAEVTEKLSGLLDFEALQIRYKQSSKAEGLETNLDAVKWLVERQGSIEDTNHHLQIDNVIIDTLT